MTLSRYTLPLLAGLLTGWLGVGHAASPITIGQAWIPEAPPVASVLAGYLTLTNTGTTTATITTASSPAFAQVEIHRTVIKDGMARMQQLQTLDIPAGKQVQLAPGGMHLMLIDPKHPLQRGDVVDVEFTLQDGTRLSARLPVRRNSGATSEPHHHH